MTNEEVQEARMTASQIGLIAIVKALIMIVAANEDRAIARTNLLRLEAVALASLRDEVFVAFNEPQRSFISESARSFAVDLIAATLLE